MIMNLGSNEIYEALNQWIKNQGISIKNKTVSIEVKAGRKGNGPSAVVTIEESQHVATPEPQSASANIMSEFDLGDLS